METLVSEPLSRGLDQASVDLQTLLLSGNISLETLETLRKESEILMKRREILKDYEANIKQLPTPDGRFWIRINGKQIFRKTKKELEDEIISRVQKVQVQDMTLNTLYDSFLTQRKLVVAPTTWQKDVRLYDMYIKDSRLASIPLVNIKTKDCYEFFSHCLSIHPDMQRRYWNNIKGTVSCLFQFAMDNDYMDTNYINIVKPARDLFDTTKITKEEDSVYTDVEASIICNAAYDDAVSHTEPCCLGIIILFNLGLRIGELCALQWKDLTVDNKAGILHIHRSMISKVDESCSLARGTQIVDHCKTKAGNRELYIGKDVLAIFNKIKELNELRSFPTGEEDLIFLREVKGDVIPCTGRCFDARLRKYCLHNNIVPKSSHDIRRTAITRLNKAGMDIKEIQKWAGHENSEMTQKYIRRQTGTDNKAYLESLNPFKIKR